MYIWDVLIIQKENFKSQKKVKLRRDMEIRLITDCWKSRRFGLRRALYGYHLLLSRGYFKIYFFLRVENMVKMFRKIVILVRIQKKTWKDLLFSLSRLCVWKKKKTIDESTPNFTNDTIFQYLWLCLKCFDYSTEKKTLKGHGNTANCRLLKIREIRTTTGFIWLPTVVSGVF